MAPEPPIEFPSGDPVREYTPEEKRRFTERLHRLATAIHSGTLTTAHFTRAFLCELHGQLFEDIRDHAGRNRSSNFGSEHLSFGPNRSVHKSVVVEQLDEIFQQVNRSLPSFSANLTDAGYEEKAIHLAVWAHAEIIRVHPFEDGNGRTSRLILDCILVKLGLRPIPIEACKQEYTDALNAYFAQRAQRNIRVLLDLFIRLYPLGLYPLD